MHLRIALLAAMCLSLLAAGIQTHRLSAARADNASLALDLAAEREVIRAAEVSAAVHRAHIDRLQRDEANWIALQTELQSMEGRDAPLSPLLRSAADRLWP